MITFSQNQLRQLAGGSEAMLRTALGNLVRREHAYVVEGLPGDLFDEIIANSLASARGYGLKAPADLATFLLLQFEIGPEFHRHPAIQEVLADPAIVPEGKLQTMYDRTPDAVWNDIASVLDRQTWFPELRDAAQG